MVNFTVGNEKFGIHIEDAQEVIRMPEITQIPQTLDFIKGVINLRGNIIPIIDMRERFNLKAKEEYSETTRVIITKFEDKLVGLIVDTVSQVITLNEDEIENAPDIIAGLSKEYLEGIGKYNDSMIILLKIDKILTTEEINLLSSTDEKKLPKEQETIKAAAS